MVHIGRQNRLRAARKGGNGIFLDGKEMGEILLPTHVAPLDCRPNDELDVFLYHDSESRIVATTKSPYGQVGEFAYLKVVDSSHIGAFLDWGLDKDLLVPTSEQKKSMHTGRSYIVYINLDETGRLYATSKIDKFLDIWPARYEHAEAVDLLICEQSDIGIKAIINHRHWGLLYEAELSTPPRYGSQVKGYINQLREDGKVDLYLYEPGKKKNLTLSDRVLATLKATEGFLPLNDKSSPELINEQFSTSKRAFKSAIGILYKKRLITIDEEGIRLKR